MWKNIIRIEKERYLKEHPSVPEIPEPKSHRDYRSQPSIFEKTETGYRSHRVSRKSSRVNNTFIPFVNERDGLNRLLTTLPHEEQKSSRRSSNMRQSYRAGSSKALTDRSLPHPVRRSQNHLGTLLDLEPEESARKRSPSPGQIVMTTGVSEEIESPILPDFSQFRVVMRLAEDPISGTKRARSGTDTERGSPRTARPTPSFCSISREKLDKMRTKSVTNGAQLRQLDAEVIDNLKPRAPRVFISSTRLERDKPLARSDGNFVRLNTMYEPNPKCIPDFSRQVGRELGSRIWPAEKKVVKTIHIPKDFRVMDKDFKFSKQLREKYILTAPNMPRSWSMKKKNCPYTQPKLTEMINNILRSYHIEKTLAVGELPGNK